MTMRDREPRPLAPDEVDRRQALVEPPEAPGILASCRHVITHGGSPPRVMPAAIESADVPS